MKIKKISYLNVPHNLVYDCVDVFVTLEDSYCTNNFSYFVEVTTPQFLSAMMEKSESEFLEPDNPYIIVSKLTNEIIRNAIQAYIDEEDDCYWLKLYHIPATLDIKDINDILYRKKQEILKEDPISLGDSLDFLGLVDQLNWDAKNQYFKLIEEFLGESSSFLNFKKKYESHVKVAKKLESNSIFLEPSYQALGFSNFSRILIQLFDRYQVDPELSPKIFKSWVRKILLEMKNHYY